MPVIAKRRANRSKAFRTRRDRFGGSSKPKPFTLSGKLKSNNNLLAKALSAQKQETQLLFTEKIQLASQVQKLTAACNRRDLMFTNIQKNAKEMLSMLVTLTNYVTNTIMNCQEFAHKSDGYTPRPSSLSTTRRESTRRLSTKSPARGVVKPMVSGHTITKPTINLRRVNVQRVNNFEDLSIIDETSPDRIIDSTINTSRTHTAAFTSSNRHGCEGERRRRLPERIPVDYVEVDDDEGDTLGRQETRNSPRFSGRLSHSLPRKRSGNSFIGQIRSPSVSLCDVSKLLQNSQTINVRMLQDSQGNGDFNRLPNTVQNFSPCITDGDISNVNINIQESRGADKSLQKTHKPSVPLRKMQMKKKKNNLEIDPMEGPSWLLNGSVAAQSFSDSEEEKTVEIFRRKQTSRKLDSSESEAEVGNNADDDSMEFTECVNPIRRPPQIPRSEIGHKRTDVITNLPNPVIQDKINENNLSSARDLDNSLNDSEDADEQCTNFNINRSNEFVTDRRRQYIEDDEDDDTIMLKMSRGVKISKFNINDLRLPVVSCPIIAPAEPNDSEPEVTTTIQVIPQNHVPPNLLDDIVEDRVSNVSSLQLPKIDDESTKTQSTKRTVKRKQSRKNVNFPDSDSSDSDYAVMPKKKTTRAPKPTNVKDPSSAKVVLQKLNDTQMRRGSTTPDQSLVDKTQDYHTTNEKPYEARNSEVVTDSNSSTQSVSERTRPRRQKAPVNMTEPKLTTGHSFKTS